MLKNIKLLRDERGLTQQCLADVIGMSQQSINAYENTNNQPDITTLKMLADYFETSVDFIVEHTDIRRKIEEVSEFALNEQEAALVNNYRQLPPVVRKIMNDLLAEISKIH